MCTQGERRLALTHDRLSLKCFRDRSAQGVRIGPPGEVGGHRGHLPRNTAAPSRSLRGLLLRGVIEVQSGRTAKAAESIRRCIRKDPTRAAAHALLGDALSGLSRPLEALESYQTALRLDSSFVSAHYGCGNVLLDLERPREALSSYDRVLQSQANDSEALFNRGNALFRLNELNAALESYARAIAVRPTLSWHDGRIFHGLPHRR
jgi:tetratricopeptide (TPR) repeat protein